MDDELKAAILSKDDVSINALISSGKFTQLPPELIPDGATVFHIATILGYLDCLQQLLATSTREEVNAADGTTGWTPLVHAIANRNTPVVMLFLNSGKCDVTIEDKFQQVALHIEAQNSSSDVEVIEMLFRCGSMLDPEDFEQMTPFMRAVESHNVLLMRYLYFRGCHIHRCSVHGKSPLHIAAQYCYEDILTWLLQIGSNINAMNNHFQTPLMVCVQQKKSPHLVFRIMKILIDSGTNINLQDCNGNTVVLLAMTNPSVIKKHHIEMLLAAGADPNIPNRAGLTPIWQAVYDGAQYPDRYHIIRLLLHENCYLDMSCRGKLLFLSGADSVYCYETFLSPFEVAMDSGFFGAAKMLVMAGCQVKPDMRYDKLSVVPNEIQWFQSHIENPASLQQQCRLVIRKVLGARLESKARKLPLPEKIKSYVLLRDVLS